MADGARVIDMEAQRRKRRAAKEQERPCPERLTADELGRLLRWAMRERHSLDEVQFAWQSVCFWWETRREPRTNWVAVCMNGMRHGWALRGYQRWHERRGRASRTITPELIEQLVAKRRPEEEK